MNEPTLHNLFNKETYLCHKCLLELKPVMNHFVIDGVKGTNVYWYTEKIQEMLYQLKGCNDYELKDIFFDYYRSMFSSKYKNFIMIPAPSSKEANERRGFNQVEAMFEKFKLKKLCCIHKTIDVKQHELHTNERQDIKNSLTIDDVDLSKKNILLVDDVFTTGSTIRSMISLVKQKNPKRIEVLVMAKTIDLKKRQI